MNFFDCFAGIGGFRLGMEIQGHTCIGFCEIDKFARRSYQAIFDTEGELEYHDITAITDDQLRQIRGQVDVLCGGFPCQAFSLAGRRLGFEDTRGTLFFELARCAKEIQPPYLFFLRTSRGYSVTTRDGRSTQSSIRWMNWGIMSSGRCLTVKISAFPKTGSGSFLSDILENEVSDQYFLSEDKVAQLILND